MKPTRAAALGPLLLLALGGCEEGIAPLNAPTFLQCATHGPRAVTARVDAGGDTLNLDNHQLVIPPGAVPQPTTFVMTATGARNGEIRIQANGGDSYQFSTPASLRLTYEGCTGEEGREERLQVVQVPSGGEPRVIRSLQSRVNRSDQWVTAPLDHLSSYALAVP